MAKVNLQNILDDLSSEPRSWDGLADPRCTKGARRASRAKLHRLTATSPPEQPLQQCWEEMDAQGRQVLRQDPEVLRSVQDKIAGLNQGMEDLGLW